MRRVTIACTSSTILHVAALSALAMWGLDQALWEAAVERGEPIVLAASLASPPPESATAVETVESSPPPVEGVATEPVEPVSVEPPQPSYAEIAPEAAPEPPPLPPVPPAPHRETPTPTLTPRLAERRPSPPLDLPTTTQADAAPSLPSTPTLTAGAKIDQPPRQLLRNPAPDYPHEARVAGWEGRVLLLVEVNPDGRVADVRVHQSSGYRVLDDAALRAVRRSRFAAAQRGGVPVAAEVLAPVRFSTRDR